MSKPKSVFIVAGEASGDLHAANMAKQLIKLDNSIKLQGMGGQNMRNAGIDILFDASELGVMGITEVLLKYKMIKGVLEKVKAHIKLNRPDLLILVDYQEFNQRLAAFAKDNGIKVLFYIGPQVWAWRPKRVYKMAKIVDQMAVIFPFEVDLYKKAGVPVQFTGHPLIDEIKHDKSTIQAREELGLTRQTTVGLFPGSRVSEVERLMPVLLETAEIITGKKPDVQYVLPLANTISRNHIADYAARMQKLRISVIENKTYDVIQACDAIIVASGTATLEIGLMGVPMAIIYKISPISYWILSRLVKLEHVGLVNIIPGKETVKEFIQNNARPEFIADEILHILDDTTYSDTIRNNLAGLRQMLGGNNNVQNIASLAYDMLKKGQ